MAPLPEVDDGLDGVLMEPGLDVLEVVLEEGLEVVLDGVVEGVDVVEVVGDMPLDVPLDARRPPELLPAELALLPLSCSMMTVC